MRDGKAEEFLSDDDTESVEDREGEWGEEPPSDNNDENDLDID
jgi:hypothetical protein